MLRGLALIFRQLAFHTSQVAGIAVSALDVICLIEYACTLLIRPFIELDFSNIL
jgi:hypothetical protein